MERICWGQSGWLLTLPICFCSKIMPMKPPQEQFSVSFLFFSLFFLSFFFPLFHQWPHSTVNLQATCHLATKFSKESWRQAGHGITKETKSKNRVFLTAIDCIAMDIHNVCLALYKYFTSSMSVKFSRWNNKLWIHHIHCCSGNPRTVEQKG